MAKRKPKPPAPNKRTQRIAARNARIMHETPLARLTRTSSLDVYELTAADELTVAHCMANGLPVQRHSELGIPMEASPGAADAAAAKRFDLLPKYQQWRRDLHGTPIRRVAEAVLFGEKSLRAIDDENRWRTTTARKHLVAALRHFAALRGNVPNGARDWKFVLGKDAA